MLSEKQPDQGQWFSEFHAEYQQGYSNDDKGTDVFAGKARLGYQLRKWVSMDGELQLYKFNNIVVSTSGLEGIVWFNWNLLNRSKLRIYFDNGFGILVL